MAKGKHNNMIMLHPGPIRKRISVNVRLLSRRGSKKLKTTPVEAKMGEVSQYLAATHLTTRQKKGSPRLFALLEL